MENNEIIETVALALRAQYPDMPIYADDIAQGLEPPGFLILTLQGSVKRYPSGRYLKSLPLDILYYPGSEGDNTDMLRVADTLFPLLEFISSSRSQNRDVLHGTEMRFEIIDGVLHFFVNYDTMLRKTGELPLMETLSSEILPMSCVTLAQNTKEATDDA